VSACADRSPQMLAEMLRNIHMCLLPNMVVKTQPWAEWLISTTIESKENKREQKANNTLILQS